jgi:hypothetical protein
MVSWKIALVVIVIAILAVAIGMWFGYQYVSEQNDLPPAGWREPSEMPNLCRDISCMSALTHAKPLLQCYFFQTQLNFLYAL